MTRVPLLHILTLCPTQPKVLWTKGIDILLALMHNARSADTDESDVEPDAIVADAAATAAAADTDGRTGSNDPPPPPPPSSSSAKEERAGGEEGDAVGGGDGQGTSTGGGEAKPFPIVIYGNGSDLDEVRRGFLCNASNERMPSEAKKFGCSQCFFGRA